MIQFNSDNETNIYNYLNTYPKSRDNDMMLVALIWRFELGNEYESTSARELFKKMVNGEVTHFETIRRTRAKLQKEYPQVRGEKYLKRLERQNDIQEDLGYGVRE